MHLSFRSRAFLSLICVQTLSLLMLSPERVTAQTTRGSIAALRAPVDRIKAEYDQLAAEHKDGDDQTAIKAIQKRLRTISEAQLPLIVEQVSRDPSTKEAFETLIWIASNVNNSTEAYGHAAVKLLLEHHAENPAVGEACTVLGYYWAWNDPSTMKFLSAVVEKNPNRTARAQALVGLARLKLQEARALEEVGGPHSDARAAAEKLFVQAWEGYADCTNLRKVGLRRPAATIGEEAASELYEIRELDIGHVAPDIAGSDMDDLPFKLSDYRGKVVVLTYWATWCGPCISEVPHERSMAERLKNKPFAFVGVNGDYARAPTNVIIKRENIPWRSFWNGGPNGLISDRWNVRSWPTVYVLDAEGKIRFKNLSGRALDTAVDALLRETN